MYCPYYCRYFIDDARPPEVTFAANSSPEYFKRAIWYPYLDSILTSTTDKFSSHQLIVIKLVALIPSAIVNYEWKAGALCYHQYLSQLSSAGVKNDFCQRKAKCAKLKEGDRPSTALEALDIIPTRFANINKKAQHRSWHTAKCNKLYHLK